MTSVLAGLRPRHELLHVCHRSKPTNEGSLVSSCDCELFAIEFFAAAQGFAETSAFACSGLRSGTRHRTGLRDRAPDLFWWRRAGKSVMTRSRWNVRTEMK
jgi:hypothetical protein